MKRIFAKGRSSTIELARVVCATRDQLPFGDWTALFASGRLPFSKRKGEMLVLIGRELGGIDAETFAHLPWGWSILYQLAQIDWRTLDALVRTAEVHPALTLRDARLLVSRLKGRLNEKSKVNFKRPIRNLRALVERTIHDWSLGERRFGQTELTEVLHIIEATLVEPAGVHPASVQSWDPTTPLEQPAMMADDLASSFLGNRNQPHTMK